MSERQVLGRGLGALIPGASSSEKESRDIPLHLIDPNPYQPRQYWDDDRIEELAVSIREHGLIQPIVLRPIGDRYQIVAGERRWRASKKAGLQRVAAFIRNYSDKEMLELALVENIQRQDLNPVETARAYRMLITEFSYTQEELGRRVGRSRSSVANTLRLLALSDQLQEMLATGTLNEGHVRPLLSLPPEKQLSMAQEIARKGFTARQAEKMARRNVSRETSGRGLDPNTADVIERLQHRLGTEVRISGNTAGELTIKFFSPEDLERVVNLILDEQENKPASSMS
ncbi:MAG: ParB/RepB/Spo0J family partition protein [bacterium]|nr:ParB/RepB/Spo0J family partition protein [bacterium]